MPGWNLQKIKWKLRNTLRLSFGLLKIISSLHPSYHPKIVGDILKNMQKIVVPVLNEIIWLMAMKTRLKTKKRSYIYNINWPRPRHGQKYTKYII